MGPAQRYQQEIDDGTLLPDKRQAKVVQSFQRLYDDLIQTPQKRWWPFSQSVVARGLYIYGSVGRGKTHLMDLFYDSLPESVPKRRQHYHDFMQWVHRRLRAVAGVSDPIEHIGQQLAKRIKILCLDEFLVNDIANAMLLAGLLKTLHQHRITLVTTSNVKPDDLYKDGLQRAKFMPAIVWINDYMEVLRLDGEKDYRYHNSHDHEHWYFPVNDSSAKRLNVFFDHVANGPSASGDIDINHRALPVIKSTGNILWCDFKALCEAARGANDYLLIGEQFDFVLIDHIPLLTSDMDDQTRRFITLVDVLYEAEVGMVCRAACHYDVLYQGKRMSFEYRRTRSRLTELLRIQPK
ncbi:cell division protein ZapE [Marinicella gelatinilytica]|uniref:cell division protein ZapE n=1 Tax=Marinicella gelatinilytica TaxID=2996017 RepID=UPI002260F0CD|nr:cell division protein ZapE [Marinicella gelatinilytica]MCX7545232.1 cell division protein ZapE [Marinicella gelatinilytica]